MNCLPVDSPVTADKLGGKAYNLVHLCDIGANVPDLFVLSADIFNEFLGDSITEYRSLLSEYDENSRSAVIEIISGCDFTEATRAAVSEMLSALGSDSAVSVRSSATDEDGEKYSFAGMMESYLNVRGIDDILEAVKKCYLSCFSERIMEYRANNGLITPDISVAVIVQRMVEADYSGVIFTTDPRTNDPDEMLISVVEGLGESLVSGESDSSDYVVACTDEIISRNEAAAKLSDEMVLKLYKEAQRIEKSYSPRRGCDIEFCIKDGEVSILQCRLITTYSHIDKDKFRTVLDNSNIIESYSGVTTPLTFTFAREVYAKIYRQTLRSFYVSEDAIESIGADLDNMLNFYENKIYYRLNSWYKMTALYPGYQKNKQYMENMMGVKTTIHESELGAKTRLVRIYVSFIRKLMRMKKDSARFIKRFNEVTGPYYGKTFDGMTNVEVLGIYDTLEHEILDDFITPIANDMGAMIFYGMLTEQLKKKNVDGYEGLISSCISKQGNVESAEQSAMLLNIVEEIKQSPELTALFTSDNDTITARLGGEEPVFRMIQEYIYRYGARTMEELKLETVTLFEDRSFLLDTIRGYLKCEQLPEYGGAADANAEKALLSNFNVFKRPFIALLLNVTKFFIRNRESLRLRRTYIYSVVRNIYLRIGKNLAEDGVLAHFRDIFFLTKSEISAIVKGYGDSTELLREKITQRRAEYEQNKSRPIYERMYFYGDVSEENMVPIYSRQETCADGVLRGVAGGGEVIEGIVRLVEDPTGADVEGYILMAKRTDPGWTVLFPMAKAIIIERGSVLSHSAVVAREMGMTLVAGIRGLTNIVKDGMRVRVDGINGTVEIIGDTDEQG
ncbi:MAG: hypothetical protein IJZ47_04785 [Oscillospiraceae bacterium]|nr:hypothetical protein [Oscillospiraceae bacterium]